MFFLDKDVIFVRNSSGVEVGFNSPEEFYNYYSGTIDLSGEYYIDYEPDKRIFYYNDDPDNVEPLTNRYSDTPSVPEYEDVIADVENMREKLDDPYFGKTLDEAKVYKLADIKNKTFNFISVYMPQWRQLKWNEYIKIYEKQEMGETLTPLEQAVYNGFPDDDETYFSCYEDALTAMNWILQCVAVNNQKEAEYKAASSIEEMKRIGDAVYPAWPLS